MNQKYQITGMSCEHCVARVQKVLAGHPAIANAKVTLTPGEADIDFKSAVSTEELQALVKKAGGYQLQAK